MFVLLSWFALYYITSTTAIEAFIFVNGKCELIIFSFIVHF